MTRITTNSQAVRIAKAQRATNSDYVPDTDMYSVQQIERDSDGVVHIYTTFNCDRILQANAIQRRMGKNINRSAKGNIKPIGQMVGRIPMVELLGLRFGDAFEYMRDPKYVIKLLKEHPEWRTCEGDI